MIYLTLRNHSVVFTTPKMFLTMKHQWSIMNCWYPRFRISTVINSKRLSLQDTTDKNYVIGINTAKELMMPEILHDRLFILSHITQVYSIWTDLVCAVYINSVTQLARLHWFLKLCHWHHLFSTHITQRWWVWLKCLYTDTEPCEEMFCAKNSFHWKIVLYK